LFAERLDEQPMDAIDFYSLFLPYIFREELFVKDPVTPQGTVALLVLFVILMAGLWFNAYFITLSRGVTQ